MTRFSNFALIVNLIGKAMRIRFCVLFDIEEYQCMHDRLPPKGMCSASLNLNFGK